MWLPLSLGVSIVLSKVATKLVSRTLNTAIYFRRERVGCDLGYSEVILMPCDKVSVCGVELHIS